MSGVSPACRSLTVDALSVHLDVVGASLDCPERAARGGVGEVPGNVIPDRTGFGVQSSPRSCTLSMRREVS